jgi:proline dehydrogenase
LQGTAKYVKNQGLAIFYNQKEPQMSISERLWKMADAIGCLIIGPLFVGGWSIDSVLKRGAKLKKQGFKITYNVLGEHVQDKRTVERALGLTLKLIKNMDNSNRGNVAIKPTLYGLQISRELFHKVAKEIIDCAIAHGIEIEFDAEMRRVIPDTFEVFKTFADSFPHRNFVRQCVQAHLTDIFDLMDKYELWDKQLRIVKGAGVYNEADGIVLTDKERVMEQYYAILNRNYSEEGQVPYVATMNDESVAEYAASIRPKSYIKPYRPVIQMLYGPRGRGLRKKLLSEGRDVRIYVPFVSSAWDFSWFGYGLRRASMMRQLIWTEIKQSQRRHDYDTYG